MASGKQPSRAARQHGETCRVFFSRSNKPRHRHGTFLQGGNAGNSILSFRNAILTFSFQSYHLAAQSCRLVRHPIIWFLHSIPIICNPILFVTPPRNSIKTKQTAIIIICIDRTDSQLQTHTFFTV